jgi:hypothetical protein
LTFSINVTLDGCVDHRRELPTRRHAFFTCLVEAGRCSHHADGDLPTGVQRLEDETPAGVLLGGGKLETELKGSEKTTEPCSSSASMRNAGSEHRRPHRGRSSRGRR